MRAVILIAVLEECSAVSVRFVTKNDIDRCPLCGVALNEEGVCPKCGYRKKK